MKLISDGGFSKDGEENDKHLNELATTLNGWIVPARVAEKVREEIILKGLFRWSRWNLSLLAMFSFIISLSDRPLSECSFLSQTHRKESPTDL